MKPEFLLISDLDDTFLGDNAALERFAEAYGSFRSQLKIVYASGRFYESIRKDIENTSLPEPIAVVGGVGSEIRDYPSGELNQHWADRISSDWSADRVRELLGDEPDLSLQPDDSQSEFKVSYYFKGARPEQLSRLQAKLFDGGISVSVIYSSSRDLDILPKGVNKGTAAAFVARELGVDQDHVFVAGNSGNDSKLFEHDFRGIIVANAHEELRAYAVEKRVYLSPYERADGVCDGVRHWMGEVAAHGFPNWSQSTPDTSGEAEKLRQEGYSRALSTMHGCLRDIGFLATETEKDNYRRVWGRDSCIIGLAALLTEDAELIDGCRRSLETLAQYQGPHGEIPSNVDPVTERVSYGGTAGRVDADLWFIIACGSYWRFTQDDDFLDRMLRPLERVRKLLGAWEFNTRGLLYIPPTGDWADEYIQSGYVLYDQLLYLQAQREFCRLHTHLHESADHDLDDRVTRLTHLIQANFWFTENGTPDDVYHEVLYEKGRQAAPERGGKYWMPFFSPFGYGFRFDGMANALVSLLGVANDEQSECVDAYIRDKIVQKELMLLPAFDPVITPKDEKWDDLQVTFSHTFKNSPYEYHNGGLWPLVTGFYAASLASRNKLSLARIYADGIHHANSLELDGEPWSFPEYVHGKKLTAGGTHPMGWSAASAVIAEKSVEGKSLFREEP